MIVVVELKENNNMLEVYNTAVQNLIDFVAHGNRPEDIQAYIVEKLTLKTKNLQSMTNLLANYIAILSMLINCRTTQIWGGPIADPGRSPVSKIINLHQYMLTNKKCETAKGALAIMCGGEPKHPLLRVEKTDPDQMIFAYVDTMGGIIDMMHVQESDTHRRKLFMKVDEETGMYGGHIFLGVANRKIDGVKAAFPYGIHRNVFSTPGSCKVTKPKFVESLFNLIEETCWKQGITHMFSFPIGKMIKRFEQFGFTKYPSKTLVQEPPEPYPELAKAIRSVYRGQHKYIADHLIYHEIQHFHFYMKRFNNNVKRIARRPTKLHTTRYHPYLQPRKT